MTDLGRVLAFRPEKTQRRLQGTGVTQMKDRNERAREIAFFMWQEEGCPEGQEKRHWRTAQAIIEEEDAAEQERKIVSGEPSDESATE